MWISLYGIASLNVACNSVRDYWISRRNAFDEKLFQECTAPPSSLFPEPIISHEFIPEPVIQQEELSSSDDEVNEEKEEETYHGQGTENHIPLMTDAVNLLGSLLTNNPEAFVPNNILKQSKENLKTAHLLMTASMKFSDFLVYLKKVFEYIADVVYEYLYGLPRDITSDKIQAVFNHWKMMKTYPEEFVPAAFVTFEQIIRGMLKQCNNHSPSKVVTVLGNMLEDVKNTHGKVCSNYFKERKGCVPPLVVQIRGPSNVGKSTAMVALAEALSLALLGTKEDTCFCDKEQLWHDFTKKQRVLNDVSVHGRNSALDFWDNYRNELVCFFDDWGQFVDTDANPSPDFQELIKIKNIAEYLLPMAALEDKGSTIFTSQIVLMTSNLILQKNLVNSLNHWEALDRRLDIIMECTAYGKFKVTRVFGIQTYQELDLDTLAPWVLDMYYKYHEHEVKVQKQVRSKLLNSIADYSIGSNWANADALNHFLHLKAYYDATPNIPEEVAKAIELGGKYFLKDEEIYHLTQTGGTHQLVQTAVVPDDHLEAYKKIFGGYPVMPLNKMHANVKVKKKLDPDDIDFPEEQIFGYSLPIFKAVNTKFAPKALKCDHKCCVISDESEGNVHYHPKAAGPIYDNFVLKNVSEPWFEKVMETLMPSNIYTSDKPLALCPYDYITKHKIPMYDIFPEDIENLSPDMKDAHFHLYNLMLKFYDCTCTEKKKCEGTHEWRFPSEISPYGLRRVAVLMNFNLTHADASKIRRVAMCKRDATELSFIQKIFNNVDNSALKAVAVVAGVISVIAGAFTIKKVIDKLNAQPELEGRVSNGVVQEKVREKRVQFVNKGRLAPEKRDDERDPNYIGNMFNYQDGKNDMVCKDTCLKVSNNIFRIRNCQTKRWLMNAVMIDGNHFLTVGHINHGLPDLDDKVELVFPVKGLAFKGLIFKWRDILQVPLRDLQEKEEVDVILCRLPESYWIPQVPMLYGNNSKFVSSRLFPKMNGKRCLLTTIFEGKDDLHLKMWSMDKMDLQERRMTYEIRPNGKVITIVNPVQWRYAYGGNDGDCGSLVYVIDPKIDTGARLIGLHVAGADNYASGLAVCTSNEQIESAMRRLNEMHPIKNPAKFELETPITYVGLITRSDDVVLQEDSRPPIPLAWSQERFKVYRSENSHIVKSPIQDLEIFPLLKQAAHLCAFQDEAGNMIDPNAKALMKFAEPVHMLNERLLDMAVNDYQAVLNAQHKKTYTGTPRNLTMEEAVFGIEGNPLYPSLNVQTSSGQPWKIKYPGKGKHRLIDLNKRWIHPALIDAILRREDFAKDGVTLEAIFEDCLKDELRPFEKVAQGKTRLFSAGPVDLTILMRMYFGSFIAHMMENRINNESGIGINPTSREWDDLAQFVQKYGDAIIAGDFGNFDGKLLRAILARLIDVICEYYKDDPSGNIVRRALWKNVIGAIHLNRKRMYVVFGCNPSGNALTALINTMFNCVYFRYLYYVGCEESGRDPLYIPFSEFVSLVAFGDDNIMGVDPSVQSFFNPDFVTRKSTEIGMEYTDEAKTGKVSSFRSIQDVTFLKRHFVKDNREKMFIGPLDLPTILNIPNWTWDDILHEELSASCEQVIRELSLYPREIFEEWKEKLIFAARKCEYPKINSSTWEGYRSSLLRGTNLIVDVRSM